MPEEKKLKLWTKEKCMVFIDVSKSDKRDWARIGKSTMFDLALNPNINTQDYIEDAMPRDEVDYYKPELPQELATYEGDKAFDYVWDMFYDMPVGTDLNKHVLLVFPKNTGTGDAPKFQAWETDSTIILNNFNSVDKKVSFSIKINDIDRGTATVSEGTPDFTKAE